MKPLMDWTTEELRDVLIYPSHTGHVGCDERFGALEELLRREREHLHATVESMRNDAAAGCYWPAPMAGGSFTVTTSVVDGVTFRTIVESARLT